MTRTEYKALHRLIRLAYAGGQRAEGKRRSAARESCSALIGLLYEAKGKKAGLMVWCATYQKIDYEWRDWNRKERFRELKSRAVA